MWILQSISVEGFWKNFSVSVDLNEDVNIFIGENGSGKTTFINIVHAVLSVDQTALDLLPFRSVELILRLKQRKKKIQVSKSYDNPNYAIIEYKIGTSKYVFPVFGKDNDVRQRRINSRAYDVFVECKSQMDDLCESSSINVHRDIVVDDDGDNPFVSRRERVRPAIDRRIDNLLVRLTEYQLQLELEASTFTKSYQYDVLSAMLYNEKFDTFNFEKNKNVKIDEMKTGLLHAYNDLGVIDGRMSVLIDRHTEKISSSVQNLEKSLSGKTGLSIHDVLPVSLLKRTEHIINLSRKLEENRNQVFFQINLFTTKINELLKTKSIVFDTTKGQKIKFRTLGGDEISIESLSSGEKQLFILLTEALLQRGKPYVFFADEPELSLHITWQKQLIGVIRELNPNCQLIVATHSPEVASQSAKKIFRMEKLINGNPNSFS